ncbi:NAD-dependent epimerase/dehydratase family protein [Afifella sp. IM 167]|uniref:NAD-dependent epimerase/dehydratase family protein n=1 Tax=Afifella sp. IM 167 TaxID=2033586 RepID=UPI001CD0211C|nr:NAD-dependent epimerase/dehydratase family protein [Afifella sp. IM 167]
MALKIDGATFLITGGASLIGSHLTDLLLEHGAREVRLLENFALGTPETIAHLLGDERVKLIRGDITRLPDLLRASEGVDGVFALAAFLTLPMSRDPALGAEVNSVGLTNTLEASRHCGVKRVLLSSSTAVYGTSADDPACETVAFRSAGLTPASMVYSASKLLGEGLCALYQRNYGLDYNVLRFSSVYGVRQHWRAVNANFIAQAHDCVLAGKAPDVPGDGSEVHDYVYVSDCARALMMAYASDRSGLTLNISTGVDTTLAEVAEAVLKAAGRTDLKPNFVADERAVTSFSSPKLNFVNDRARETIGWEPQVSVEEGIARFVAWRAEKLKEAA